MSTPSYRWAFVAPSDALKYVADPALTTYTDATHALQYASGSFVIVTDGECVISAADAEDLLREFACNAALRQLHEWDAPDVVKEYLTTRNPDLREAARDAAWAATCDDARDAQDAAWAAAWAAQDAAQDAAWDVARNAAWAAQEAAQGAQDVAWAAQDVARYGGQLDTFLVNQLRLST